MRTGVLGLGESGIGVPESETPDFDEARRFRLYDFGASEPQLHAELDLIGVR